MQYHAQQLPAVMSDFEAACLAIEIESSVIRGPSRMPPITDARRAIAKWLRLPRRGGVRYSYPEITAAMRFTTTCHTAARHWCIAEPSDTERIFTQRLEARLKSHMLITNGPAR